MMIESCDEMDKRRSTRKRKLTNDRQYETKPTAYNLKSKASNKISSSSLTSIVSTNSSLNSIKDTVDLRTRASRNRSKTATYYELSDELSANGTDDDSSNRKRVKKTDKRNLF